MAFHKNCGKNVSLSADRKRARQADGRQHDYGALDDTIVFSAQSLLSGRPFTVKAEEGAVSEFN